MKELMKFLKSSGIYFVGTVMTKLISFLLLPLYTSYISPHDMGVYDLYNAIIMFFCSVLFLDIWSGIMRFMFDYKDNERKKPISSGITIFLGSSLLYTLLLIFAVPILNLKYPFWLFLYGLLMNGQTLVGYIARGYGKNVLYTSAGILGSFTTILFNIILLVYFKMDFKALFIASCIGYLVNILFVIIGIKDFSIFSLKNFDKQIFKELLKFSLPLCLNSVAYWFLTSYNRIVVSNVLGPEANGFYAVAGRFGSMITLFTTCFQMAWQELAYSKSAQENNLDNFYSLAINNYILVMGIGLSLLIPAIYIIYPIMINNSYDVGKSLVPCFLFGTILSTISSFLGNAFSAIKKNRLLFWTMLVGSITNVLMIHLLINKIGIQASNISLVCGFFMICFTRVILFKKYVNLKLDYTKIIVLLVMIAFTSYVYLNMGVIANLISFVIAFLISLYLIKDIIKIIFAKVFNKKNSNLLC